MTDDPSPPISEVLRALIDNNTKPLKRIAGEAGVDYRRFHRWYAGATETLDADMAEAVYKTLSGRSFVRVGR